jgi:hypothetical protein
VNENWLAKPLLLTNSLDMSRSAALKRQINLRTATALIVGEVIAISIFLTPAGMAKSLGSPVWLLVVWLVMGGMALCGALCFCWFAARVSRQSDRMLMEEHLLYDLDQDCTGLGRREGSTSL